MNKSQNTDLSIGVVHDYNEDKFREVRSRAKVEEEERYRKAKKDPKVLLPKHKIDELVVTAWNYNNPKYMLVEIVDMHEDRYDRFTYYGIVRKVSMNKLSQFIGRIVHFADEGYGKRSANVGPNSIKWLVEEK